MFFLYLLLTLANLAFASIFTDEPPAVLTTPHDFNETARPHAVVFQFQYVQEQGKYYTFLTMDELRARPRYGQAICYQSYSTEFEMLEFYPDAGWDHDDLACRVFDRRSCDTGGHHATFTYKVDEDCYHDLGLCHSGDFYWANKVASMKCWKKSYGYPDGEIV